MLKKTVLAAMLLATSLVSFPQAAAAYPDCALNCVWIETLDGGYWICDVDMACVQ